MQLEGAPRPKKREPNELRAVVSERNDEDGERTYSEWVGEKELRAATAFRAELYTAERHAVHQMVAITCCTEITFISDLTALTTPTVHAPARVTGEPHHNHFTRRRWPETPDCARRRCLILDSQGSRQIPASVARKNSRQK